jgi:hypothetical protein
MMKDKAMKLRVLVYVVLGTAMITLLAIAANASAVWGN